MKQRITLEQLLKLSPKGKKNLYKWWKLHWSDVIYDMHNPKHGIWQYISNYTTEDDRAKRDGLLPVLSIGQMMEFLDENYPLVNSEDDVLMKPYYFKGGLGCVAIKYWDDMKKTNLCDCLWQVVKEVLERE